MPKTALKVSPSLAPGLVAGALTLARQRAARQQATQPRYQPQGNLVQLFSANDPEVLVEGPAGTGKSRAILQRWHELASTNEGAKGLILRKTLASLRASGLQTYERDVIAGQSITLHGGSWNTPPHYRYPKTGARLFIGSLHTSDAIQAVMSTEYDWIYPQEATELAESEFEALTTRLRAGHLPHPQIVADCNPGPPSHWLNARAASGRMRRIVTRHTDNPRYWDEAVSDWTEEGRRYVLGTLANLTGVYRKRLYEGIWAAAEGMIYDGWDPAVHLVEPFPIPAEWPRYLIIDFGFTNPFCCQWWAEDPDGRLYRYREWYRTQMLVSDHAEAIRRLSEGEPAPRMVICDWDAEGRATLERELDVHTTPAEKAVLEGIQAVAKRLRPAGDGRPRLLLFRDALVEPDPALQAAHKPLCTEQEIEGYVWDTRAGQRRGEQPLKENDHGMDCLRYVVATIDGVGAPNYDSW